MAQRLVLVDTSVWIEYLRNGHGQGAEVLDNLLSDGNVAICEPIIAEVLSGIKSKSQFSELRKRLAALYVLRAPDDIWYIIAQKRALLSAKGFQTSLIDLWIAQVAFQHHVLLWTLDKDFEIITQAIPYEKFSPNIISRA